MQFLLDERNHLGLLCECLNVSREFRGGGDDVVGVWVPPMHHGLGNPVRGHSGWSILPVAHLEHRLEQLQVPLKGHAPETTEGAKLIQGLGEVQRRMKLWLLEACILPFRYLLEGREKGVVQLVELIPWLGLEDHRWGHGHGRTGTGHGQGNGHRAPGKATGRAEQAGTAALCMALCMVCKGGKSRLVQGSTVNGTSTTTTTNVARTVDSAEERMSCNKAAQRDLGHPAQPRRLLLVLDQWFHYNQAVGIQVSIQG